MVPEPHVVAADDKHNNANTQRTDDLLLRPLARLEADDDLPLVDPAHRAPVVARRRRIVGRRRGLGLVGALERRGRGGRPAGGGVQSASVLLRGCGALCAGGSATGGRRTVGGRTLSGRASAPRQEVLSLRLQLLRVRAATPCGRSIFVTVDMGETA